jgi:hypothetical protein
MANWEEVRPKQAPKIDNILEILNSKEFKKECRKDIDLAIIRQMEESNKDNKDALELLQRMRERIINEN